MDQSDRHLIVQRSRHPYHDVRRVRLADVDGQRFGRIGNEREFVHPVLQLCLESFEVGQFPLRTSRQLDELAPAASPIEK